MTKQQITDIVTPLLAESKYKEVLELLSDYTKGRDRYIENDLLMQTASFNRNSRDYTSGLLTRPEYNVAMAKLTDSLNYIIERLPATGNSPQNTPTAGVISIPQPDAADQKKKILFLTANPKNPDGPALRTESEMRAVKDELRQSTGRDLFELIFEPAVKIPTITRAMRANKPQIIHFSGHGHTTGIVVEGINGEIILFPTEGLDRLFRISKEHVHCVLLNACYSKAQAQVISNHDIYVIGINHEIGDETAKEFAVGFYQSLGEGDSVEIAYEMAMVNIAHKLEYANLPELWHNGEKISS